MRGERESNWRPKQPPTKAEPRPTTCRDRMAGCQKASTSPGALATRLPKSQGGAHAFFVDRDGSQRETCLPRSLGRRVAGMNEVGCQILQMASELGLNFSLQPMAPGDGPHPRAQRGYDSRHNEPRTHAPSGVALRIVPIIPAIRSHFLVSSPSRSRPIVVRQ